MRVLIVIRKNYPGGSAAAGLVANYARAIRYAGHQARVLAVGSKSDHSGWRYDEHGTPYWLCAAKSKQVRNLQRMREWFKSPHMLAETLVSISGDWKPDVVIAYGQSYHNQWPITRACHKLNLPVVSAITEWWEFSLERFRVTLDNSLFRRRLLQGFDGFIAISPKIAELLQNQQKPTVVIPALGEHASAEVSHHESQEKKSFNLTYIGSMQNRDLPTTMHKAVAHSIENGIPIQWSIIGKVDAKRSSRNAIDRIRNDPRLTGVSEITGWVSDEELHSRRAATDAFIILRENDLASQCCFPFRLSDFLLTGKPVILSNVGVVSHLFRHKENALLVPGGDHPKEVAEAIAMLYADNTLSKSIGRAAQETARRELSFQSNAQRLFSFLERIAFTVPMQGRSKA